MSEPTPARSAATEPESIEPDYDSAAEAWLSLTMTIEAMRHNNRCQEIAAEYERRLTAERAEATDAGA